MHDSPRASGPRPDGATELLAAPAGGRVFTMERRVRLGDVGPDSVLRLDAAVRYLQDIAAEDSIDARLPNAMGWVVRRTLVEVVDEARFNEMVSLHTWCQGEGPRWAERRTDIVGPRGTALQAVTLWVHIDVVTGAPVPLVPEFDTIWGGGAPRPVRARLLHEPPPPDAAAVPWTLRTVDVDALGHVNNAVPWVLVDAERVGAGLGHRLRVSMEYPAPIDPAHPVELVTADGPTRRLWVRDGSQVLASAEIVDTDAASYPPSGASPSTGG